MKSLESYTNQYVFSDRVFHLKYFFLSTSKGHVNFTNGRILSDKIVNSAEGTNLLIEEGPQTMKTEIIKRNRLAGIFQIS